MAADPDCLFCRIVAGTIPSTKVHEDDLVVAFRDIAPRRRPTSSSSPAITSPRPPT